MMEGGSSAYTGMSRVLGNKYAPPNNCPFHFHLIQV